MRDASDDAAHGWTRAERGWAGLLVLLLSVQLALWGSFLVPFRIGGTLVPVSVVLAVVGNVLIGRAGARVAGTTGAVVPGLLWIAVTLVLASRRAEGDVVVPGSAVGMAFLVAGALASAVAYGTAVVRTPGNGARR